MVAELFAVVKSGNVDSARQMLLAGADVNSRDSEGATLLMAASHAGNLPMVLTLIEAGAEVNSNDERGWTSLMKAAYNAELNCGFAEIVHAHRRGSER
jgi:ankyrin repeat protein